MAATSLEALAISDQGVRATQLMRVLDFVAYHPGSSREQIARRTRPPILLQSVCARVACLCDVLAGGEQLRETGRVRVRDARRVRPSALFLTDIGLDHLDAWRRKRGLPPAGIDPRFVLRGDPAPRSLSTRSVPPPDAGTLARRRDPECPSRGALGQGAAGGLGSGGADTEGPPFHSTDPRRETPSADDPRGPSAGPPITGIAEAFRRQCRDAERGPEKPPESGEAVGEQGALFDTQGDPKPVPGRARAGQQGDPRRHEPKCRRRRARP